MTPNPSTSFTLKFAILYTRRPMLITDEIYIFCAPWPCWNSAGNFTLGTVIGCGNPTQWPRLQWSLPNIDEASVQYEITNPDDSIPCMDLVWVYYLEHHAIIVIVFVIASCFIILVMILNILMQRYVVFVFVQIVEMKYKKWKM